MNTTDRHIIVLSAECFARAYEWTNVKGNNLEPVAFGAFNHPRAGLIDAYAKFYPNKSRGYINEITGWLLAKAFGLPIPEYAFLALVPLKKLPDPLLGITKLANDGGIDYWPAFATSKASATEVTPFIDTPTLVEEIKRWNRLHDCIAFDERSANTDRHVNNLVRIAHREFVAIDHGRLAWTKQRGEWSRESLQDCALYYPNRLMEICWGESPEKRDANATVLASHALASCEDTIADELRDWCTLLLEDPDDRAAWCEFLAERLLATERLLRERFQLVA